MQGSIVKLLGRFDLADDPCQIWFVPFCFYIDRVVYATSR